MSVLGAAVLFAVEFSLRPQELGILVLVWNVVLRWGFFVLVVLALTELQDFLEREAALSRSDPTTGLANSRSFVEFLEAEIARLRRYPCPFSIAYLDVDNFKRVNDQHGHTAGDQLLFRIAGALKEGVRATDHVARLGGDEFAILLPETVQPEARSLLERLQKSVELLTQGQGWPITVSIGLVTFNQAPKSAEEVIMAADDLMYAVKREGKAGIREKSLP
jgi:diguanylate cyclase (GGDEF)-like protein